LSAEFELLSAEFELLSAKFELVSAEFDADTALSEGTGADAEAGFWEESVMIVEAPKSTKTETMLKAIGADANSTTNNMHNIISIPIGAATDNSVSLKPPPERG